MTDEEIRKDIEARIEKARKRPHGACPDKNCVCHSITPEEARAMLIEYRKAVLEEAAQMVEFVTAKSEGRDTIAATVRALAVPKDQTHVHTDACYSSVPETEGTGNYLSCQKVSGQKG